MTIETPEDWWREVYLHWEDLVEIAHKVGLHEMVAGMEKAKCANDAGSLCNFFDAIWWYAPDAPHIHGWPSWGTLCELCSESHVLESTEETVDPPVLQ